MNTLVTRSPAVARVTDHNPMSKSQRPTSDHGKKAIFQKKYSPIIILIMIVIITQAISNAS